MTTSTDKKFDIKLDKTKKIMFAKAFGSFGPADANGFVSDYTALIKTVNTKEYELQFDCKELKVSGKDVKSGVDMTNMLKGCLEMYKNEEFKSIIFDCTKNIVLKMQLNRLCKEASLSNSKII